MYRNPDLDDRIYDCLLTAMAAVQAANAPAAFLSVDYLNGHHRELLGSTTTNRHYVVTLDFATVSDCDQLVIGPTHANGGTLNLLMTDVPDLVRVAVVAPLDSSDHSSLSIAISMAQAIHNLCVSRRVLLKHRVNLAAVCDAIDVLPWLSIWRADNPVERLNVYLSSLLERFVRTKMIRVRNKDKPWFNDDCRLTFDMKQGTHLQWTRDRSRVNWDEFVHYQRRANAAYAEAMCRFSVRSRDVLMNAQCPHKWWSTLKSAVSGSSSDSSLPPIIGAGGGLVCESVRRQMLSANFDGKQSRDSVDLQSTCHPSPSLTTFAFRSREVKRLLLYLDSYGGTDPLGMFPLFLKKTAEVLAPCLAVVFRRLLRLDSFPVCWRVANVTPIPKGPPSSSASNYRLISLTPILSKGFQRLVSIRLGVLWNSEVCFYHPVRLYERSWHLWRPSLCGTHLTECFGAGAGG